MNQATEHDIGRKGFSVLYGKWLGAKRPVALIGLNPNKSGKHRIGYLAYSNVGFKNMIPDSGFFCYDKLIRQKNIPKTNLEFSTSGRLEQSVNKSEYIKKILQIKELLACGEIYQMCYCVRFRKKFEGSPYALFQKLISVNPTDYSAYLNFGDFQIISNSPEGFFRVKNQLITTTPIKGTVRKSVNDQIPMTNGQLNDKNLVKLLNSEKERAELDMITDLERNDVGKICEYGTLKITKERGLIELKNIWHTYSEVQGRLSDGTTADDVIKAMFPGGSITGCPKKRAMEYISQLEGLPRNIFTGSVGYISDCGSNRGSIVAPIVDNKINIAEATRSGATKRSGEPQSVVGSHNWTMDFNIAIRTALVKDGWVEFWAGGGIVADSNPEKEYDECHLKAERFLDIIKSQV
jgi:para-aminobenzoate synthetase component I